MATCAVCGAPAARSYTQRVKTGESVSHSTKADGNPQTNKTEHFSFRTVNLCEVHYKARVRAQIIMWSLVALAVAAGLLWYALQNPSKPSTNTATVPVTNSVTAEDSSTQTFKATPDADTNAAPPPADAPPPAPDQSASTQDVPAAPPAGSAAGPGVIPELAAALQSALSTGETRNWSAGAMSGFAVPGGSQAYPGRICRSYRYTVTQSGNPTQTNDGLACHPDDGGPWSLDAKAGT